jgi:hypothetical protein
MSVEDYSKFYEMLLRRGLAPNGARVLSERSVRILTHGSSSSDGSGGASAAVADVSGAAPGAPTTSGGAVARLMELDEKNPKGQWFEHGWAVVPSRRQQHGDEGRPHCNYWSGYANNHGRLYCEDDS